MAQRRYTDAEKAQSVNWIADDHGPTAFNRNSERI